MFCNKIFKNFLTSKYFSSLFSMNIKAALMYAYMYTQVKSETLQTDTGKNKTRVFYKCENEYMEV